MEGAPQLEMEAPMRRLVDSTENSTLVLATNLFWRAIRIGRVWFDQILRLHYSGYGWRQRKQTISSVRVQEKNEKKVNCLWAEPHGIKYGRLVTRYKRLAWLGVFALRPRSRPRPRPRFSPGFSRTRTRTSTRTEGFFASCWWERRLGCTNNRPKL